MATNKFNRKKKAPAARSQTVAERGAGARPVDAVRSKAATAPKALAKSRAAAAPKALAKPKAAAAPKAATAPKAVAKPKAAAAPKTAAAPKAAAAPRAVAKPKATAAPKAAARPRAAARPKAAAAPKAAAGMAVAAAAKPEVSSQTEAGVRASARSRRRTGPRAAATATSAPPELIEVETESPLVVEHGELEAGETAGAGRRVRSGASQGRRGRRRDLPAGEELPASAEDPAIEGKEPVEAEQPTSSEPTIPGAEAVIAGEAEDEATSSGAPSPTAEDDLEAAIAAVGREVEPDEGFYAQLELPLDVDSTGEGGFEEERAIAPTEALIGVGPAEEDGEVADTRGYLRGLIEAILFVSDRPLLTKEVARAAKIDKRRAQELIDELRAERESSGICLEEVAGGYAFRSHSRYATYLRGFLAQRPVRLSRAQLETLAIIAYRQPITRPEVDDIRGVDSGPVLKGLLERDLIRILGKKDEPGRPMLYGTTTAFLELFSLQSLRELPTLKEFTELSDDSRRKFEEELGEEPPDEPVDLSGTLQPGGDEASPLSGDDEPLGEGDGESFGTGEGEPAVAVGVDEPLSSVNADDDDADDDDADDDDADDDDADDDDADDDDADDDDADDDDADDDDADDD